jgi:D-alanyl-D-alanine carboxypeptidase (penicillin-binding protein 5/6)
MSVRLLRGLWVLCLIFCITPAVAEALEVSATAAVLMDADMGQVLYEKNGDRQMLIASTTKIMTALVVLEHAAPDDVITVTPNHMAEGSSMYLRAGETVRVEELLYGLLLCSGNDAALALTECAGGLTPFVALMNEKAAALGMAHTSFANPNGLDADGHYSTARDMAVLAAAAVENPTFRRICSSRSVTIGQRTMENHNRLLRQVEGCIGLKTGYTRAAGRTLVSCTERDGCRLVAVTLQDGNDWADHAALYDYGFRLTAPRRGVQTALLRLREPLTAACAALHS